MMNRRSWVGAATLGGIAAPLAKLHAQDNCATPPPVPAARQSNEIVMLSARELSIGIHRKRFSCREVMAAYVQQIERLNPSFNAIVARADTDQLMTEADQADQELARGTSRGWMHGFPFAAKDLADAKGFVTSRGSRIFADARASADSIHIARIKGQGAIIVGKTNVPEFGMGSQSYNDVYGVTRCAYDASRTAGGSSGGAAAALALRMLPVADGSDMMGSLRNPGAFNNVIGFRPTPGVVPLGRSFQETLACNGPMGRDVADTARLLATMAGAHPDDPNSLPIDPQQFNTDLTHDWRGARIGWLGDFAGYLPMQDGVLAVCEAALDGFRDVGMTVEPARVDFSMAELWQTWLTYRHWMNRGRGLRFLQNPAHKALLKPEMIWEIEGGAEITGDQLSRAVTARGRWYGALVKMFERYDALVWPTAQVFPFAATTHWPKAIAGKPMDTYHRWMETVVPGTLSGCPVINVPAGFSAQGLPMGLQVMTPRFKDLKALKLAYAYEQSHCWQFEHLPAVV